MSLNDDHVVPEDESPARRRCAPTLGKAYKMTSEVYIRHDCSLGSSSISEVFTASKDGFEEVEYAIKIPNPAAHGTASKELAAVHKYENKCPNIVKWMDYNREGVIVFELGKYSLDLFLLKEGRNLTMTETVLLVQNLLCAIQFLYSGDFEENGEAKMSYAHRNIKPSNVILFEEMGELVFKLSDHSYARPVDQDGGSTMNIDHNTFTDPRIKEGKRVDEKEKGHYGKGKYNTMAADLWSCAAVIYYAVTLKQLELTDLRHYDGNPLKFRLSNKSIITTKTGLPMWLVYNLNNLINFILRMDITSTACNNDYLSTIQSIWSVIDSSIANQIQIAILPDMKIVTHADKGESTVNSSNSTWPTLYEALGKRTDCVLIGYEEKIPLTEDLLVSQLKGSFILVPSNLTLDLIQKRKLSEHVDLDNIRVAEKRQKAQVYLNSGRIALSEAQDMIDVINMATPILETRGIEVNGTLQIPEIVLDEKRAQDETIAEYFDLTHEQHARYRETSHSQDEMRRAVEDCFRVRTSVENQLMDSVVPNLVNFII